MKQQLSSIYAALETISFIKWIDMDYGQLEAEERPAVAFPCALVDIAYPNCTDEFEESREQSCDCVVTVRLAFLPRGATHAAAPQLQRTLAFSILDNVKEVASALHGLTLAGSTEPLSRKSQLPERRDDGLRVYQLQFRGSVMEVL